MGRALALAAAYTGLWLWLWNGGETLPNVNNAAAAWGVFLGAVVIHVAIGYLIGNWWAVGLALVPALTLPTAEDPRWWPLAAVAYGLPVAGLIASGVGLRNRRDAEPARTAFFRR